MMEPVPVPWDALSDETLDRLVKEFVTRDGTDYGVRERSEAEKVARTIELLRKGRAQIVFDPLTSSTTILPVDGR